jgi:hypothetical protein
MARNRHGRPGRRGPVSGEERKSDFEAVDLGEQNLKNIAEPIRAYSLEVGSQRRPSRRRLGRRRIFPLWFFLSSIWVVIQSRNISLMASRKL